jgi:hypothetical protein
VVQRDDITVRWDLDPRLITIAAPSTEIIIQDLHDTLREIESQQQNLVYPFIISTAGGEDLGGGVSVGLTATLQNAQIKFESRFDHVADGYASEANDVGGIILTDAGASFISNGVLRGATITNFPDLSHTTIIRVISETQVEHEPLAGGTTNKWEIGDFYKIHNEIQCEITGGNLVAVDAFGSDIDSVSPSAFVQILRTSASSATSRNSIDIEYASFGGGVTVDLNSSFSGVNFPVGTQRAPVNNLSDALLIVQSRGFTKFFVKGNANINSGLSFKNLIFIGESQSKSRLTIIADADVEGCEFNNAIIDGVLDGYSTINNCLLEDLLFFNGLIKNSGLRGTITLAGGQQASIINCYDDTAGTAIPTIDMGGDGQSLILPNYNGGIRLINKSGLDEVSINLNSGRVILDSTVTNGEIIVRGIGKITNASTAQVDAIDLIEGRKIQTIAYDGAVHVDTIDGIDGAIFGVSGLPAMPIKTLADAIILGEEIGLKEIHLRGSDILPHNLDNWIIKSEGRATLNFDGYDISGGTFYNLTLSGTVGLSSIPSIVTDLCGHNCILTDSLENLRGIFHHCIIYGKISVRSDAQLLLNDLHTDEKTYLSTNIQFPAIPTNPPTIDVNGGQLVVSGLDGYLVIENVNNSNSYAVISMNSGHVIIDSSCTAGDIIIRGNGTITNDGTASVITTGTISSAEISSNTFKKIFPFIA